MNKIWQQTAPFFCWLFGFTGTSSEPVARVFALLLPPGVNGSSTELLSRAVSHALIEHRLSTDAVLRFVFAQLTVYEAAKVAAVMHSVLSARPPEEAPASVRTAIMMRPRLATIVVRQAIAQVPSEALRIFDAAESVVAGLSLSDGQKADAPRPVR